MEAGIEIFQYIYLSWKLRFYNIRECLEVIGENELSAGAAALVLDGIEIFLGYGRYIVDMFPFLGI